MASAKQYYEIYLEWLNYHRRQPTRPRTNFRNNLSATVLNIKSGNIISHTQCDQVTTTISVFVPRIIFMILQIFGSCTSFGLVFPRVNANSRRVNNSTTFIWNRTQYRSGTTIMGRISLITFRRSMQKSLSY